MFREDARTKLYCSWGWVSRTSSTSIIDAGAETLEAGVLSPVYPNRLKTAFAGHDAEFVVEARDIIGNQRVTNPKFSISSAPQLFRTDFPWLITSENIFKTAQLEATA